MLEAIAAGIVPSSMARGRTRLVIVGRLCSACAPGSDGSACAPRVAARR
jgi:hypothetical protein